MPKPVKHRERCGWPGIALLSQAEEPVSAQMKIISFVGRHQIEVTEP
jgi:hypothetical protein